ncbi:hypothetical protein [Kitasatospora sp. NPDC091207]|uniref:hypothetical protein n=1 Tax=Kitasatospora sp. NPDC091207 TaxID=3364083 RepID=UPI0038173592
MAKTVRHRPGNRPRAVTQHNRQVAAVTAGLLVVVSLYSAALGPNGWLWFGWTVLLLACVGLFAVRG